MLKWIPAFAGMTRLGFLEIPLFLCVRIAFFFLFSHSTHAVEGITDILNQSSQLQGIEASHDKETPPKIDYIPAPFIILNVLDKITARVSEIKGAVDQKITFGNLEIVPALCYKAPPDEKAESVAYLKIYDKSQEKESKLVFSGWMFASSPALSTAEHPVYDVWVKECCETVK